MKHERTEDLNPRSDDVEAKVARMLDLSLPDQPEKPDTHDKSSKANKPAKIQSVSIPTVPKSQELPSAPELPIEGAKKSGKVIIPVSHADEPDLKPGLQKTSTDEVAEVKQVTITDHEGSTDEVAEKLDEAIAELDTKGLSSNKPPENVEPTETEKSQGSKEAESIAGGPDITANPATDKAVDEIIAAEGDELLEVEDAVRDTDEPVEPTQKIHQKPWQRIKNLWSKPVFRWSFLLFFLTSAIVAASVPKSRYFLLNSAGVRARSSMIVLDQSTHQPLKNVAVTIGTVKSTTDEEGKVDLKKVKLGSSSLTIEKRAFAKIQKNIVVGWGSNPLGEFSLTPTGTQYSFKVDDFLSGKPLSKIEASSGV